MQFILEAIKKEKINQIIFPQKTIKFKKDFHCFKECNFCIKYIARKEEQWKEYIIFDDEHISIK